MARILRTILIATFTFIVFASAFAETEISDEKRPETGAWYRFCMSQRDYGLEQLDFENVTFKSDLDGDERFDLSVRPSCNFSRRVGEEGIRGIVIHYTNGSAESSLAWWQEKYPGTSAHYLIKRDGSIIQSIPEAYTAYHLGCYWEKENCLNCPDELCDRNGYFSDPIETTIGIELENAGPVFEEDDGSFTDVFHRSIDPDSDVYFYFGSNKLFHASRYYQCFTEVQLKTLANLIDSIESRYGNDLVILGHGDIQQASVDPGPAFPRDEFFKGFGSYFD
ncbi:MAG: N-acetylmuramoyl-L-alanine amidase [Anaerolineaceae bacterium]|nr:N-acetylmuramoyl-L-alanine amidase [Anaerolineaceae bacterium]